MKVFVAGAGGAIGRPLIPRLVEAGHRVAGATRRAERAEEICAMGADAVVVDVFDAQALRAVMAEAAVAGRTSTRPPTGCAARGPAT